EARSAEAISWDDSLVDTLFIELCRLPKKMLATKSAKGTEKKEHAHLRMKELVFFFASLVSFVAKAVLVPFYERIIG
ncbi:MAG: hypothetical protein KAJ05_09660, partial [Candidatus Latescibacteria bacterium]|nr:hypothetical protein [Candidatus Latescibacterota bacterium]